MIAMFIITYKNKILKSFNVVIKELMQILKIYVIMELSKKCFIWQTIKKQSKLGKLEKREKNEQNRFNKKVWRNAN